MSWFEAVPALLTALGLIVVPGYAVARALSLRGLWAWGVAGPASVSVIVLASLISGALGVPWSVIPVAVTSVLLAGVGFATVRFSRGRGAVRATQWSSRRVLVVVSAFVVAAVLLGMQIVLVVGSPENISQTFDNIFHLNATRYILDTQNASPLSVGGMTSADGAASFYPAAWHSLVALVVQISGSTIMVATNAVTVVTAAVLWPAAIVLLSATLFGGRTTLVVSAAVLSGMLPAFPLLLVHYGVLYPYLLGVSLVPAALAAVVQLVRGDRDGDEISTPSLVLVVVGLLPGLAISHPGALVAWIALSVIVVWVAFVAFLRTRPERRRVLSVSALVAAVTLASIIAWRVLRPPLEARGWPTEQTISQALGQALTLSPRYLYIPLLATALFFVGIVVLIRRRRRDDILALALLTAVLGLYVVASALPWQPLRDLITAAWYNNAPRLAALIPIMAIPLIAVGATTVIDRIGRAVHATRIRGVVVTGVTVLAVALTAGQAIALGQVVQVASVDFQYGEDSPLVSNDERELLERLPDEVPADALIIGSPWTGAGMAYAFADRDVVMPHILMGMSADEQEIVDEFSRSAERDEVCEAVTRSGVDYILDFGDREIHGGDHSYRGFQRLSSSDLVTLVDSEGDVALYEITGCE